MIISVASGKGGTGKTTVSTNLALSVGKAQFIDCDVEEPNANIFIKTELEEYEDVSVSIPKIDEEKCDYCGKCSEFCVYNALAVVPSKVLVFPEGERSYDGSLQQPKAGLGLIAAKARVPVIPAYVYGTYRALPRNRSLILPAKIIVAFGKPIYFDKMIRHNRNKKELEKSLWK